MKLRALSLFGAMTLSFLAVSGGGTARASACPPSFCAEAERQCKAGCSCAIFTCDPVGCWSDCSCPIICWDES